MDMDQSLRILGLEKGIDLETGRRAWRSLVRQWHPDRFAQAPDMRTLAEERLKEINEAWTVVRPALTRARQDPSRPGILKTLRRIRLRRILREIFADPQPATGPQIRPDSTGVRTSAREKAGGKTFDEIFNEMSGQHRPRNRSGNVAGRKVRPLRPCPLPPPPRPPPGEVSNRLPGTGAVRGIEASDGTKAVPRSGRIRGIGRKR